eukprot:TRINITY_DN665_c0_g1_i3.p1 TRINITY_DN665_c0_g1~~TRINITY_DN665_c0_g1_i3.p1  ORF type:complete len:267 (+),score=44.23 TRINITY_DN665_c0_g1_i3:444-1244(+)
MLSRQQRYRRLRHNNRPRSEPRVPLSLFAEGGELANAHRQPTLLKSFSDRGPQSGGLAAVVEQAEAADREGSRLRRTISDSYMAQSRSLFRAKPEPPQAAVVEGRGKGVRFGPQVQVFLIPTARELPLDVKAGIWWSKSDLQSFQRALVTALPAGCDLKQSVLALGSVVAASEAACEASEDAASAAASIPVVAYSCPAATHKCASAEAESGNDRTVSSAASAAPPAAAVAAAAAAASHVHFFRSTIKAAQAAPFGAPACQPVAPYV